MIYDCFTFYNENNILNKRLLYLNNGIDKFVVVESTVTHRGNPKELYFDISVFPEEIQKKIIHIVVEDNPTDKDPWTRENHQRVCIQRGLNDATDDDIILVSDVDEIPNEIVVKQLDSVLNNNDLNIVSFHMYAFEFSLMNMQVREPWFGTVAIRYKFMKENSITPQQMRQTRWSHPRLMRAGWHMSSFGDSKFVNNKMQNFAHCYDKTFKELNEDTIKQNMENKLSSDGVFVNPPTPQEILDSIPGILKD